MVSCELFDEQGNYTHGLLLEESLPKGNKVVGKPLELR
jgi:hypothetical protein